MLSKKHNDPLYWKHKLDTLDCLPGDAATEKDALWDKLHARLHKKTVGKKVMWYRVAAILLPIIITTIIATISKTDNMLVNQPTQKEQAGSSIPAVLLPASKEVVTIKASAPVYKKQAVTIINVKTNSKIFTDTVHAPEVAVVKALPENPVAEATGSIVLSPDTAATVTVIKKKLTVVHINELENFPVQFTMPVNYAQSIKPKKDKTNNLSFAPEQNIIGFKIKLSSKN